MANISETTDAAGSAATLYQLAPGDQFTGAILPAGDEDWLRAVLEANYGYYATLTTDGSGGALTNAYLTLRDNGGSSLEYDYGSAPLVVSYDTTAAGTHFLEVQGYTGANTGSYTVTLQREVAGHSGTRESLGLGGTFNSTIDYGGDRDWVKVTFEANYGYYVTLTTDGSLAALPNAYLYLRDNGGSMVAYDYGSGTLTAAYDTTAAGTWFIDIRGNSTTVTGNYAVTLQREVADHSGTRETLALGGTFESAIDYGGDRDWVKTTLEANYGYYVTLTTDGSPAALADAYLYLRDNGGGMVAYDYGSGTLTAAFSTTAAGTYFLDIRGNSDTLTGSYAVTLQRETADHSGTRDTLALGETRVAAVDYNNDSDWYRITLEAGQTVTIATSTSHPGVTTPALQDYLYLRNAAGSSVRSGDAGPDGRSLTYTALTTGTFFIEVEAWVAGGYALSMVSAPRIGGSGADTFTGSRLSDELRGMGGGDWLTPGAGNDTVDGGEGVDMASYVDATTRGVIDLGAGTAIFGAETDILRGIENVTGTIFADLITGNAGANRIRALGDYDWLVGSGGGDTFEGGTGRDTVAYSNSAAAVTASLLTDIGTGTAGQALGDSYIEIENLTGSSFNDRLTGSDDRNTLRGLAGDDFLFGRYGNDTIDGGTGRDSIDGGAANDWMTGGRGNDTIAGSSGWDTAVYSGNRAAYTVTANADGSVTVLHTGGGIDGVDLLTGVEVLEFANGRLFL